MSAPRIELPAWAVEYAAGVGPCPGDPERMAVAVELARRNVLENSGGPFGAALFAEASGELVAVGVNSVERLNNSVLHAELMALMHAEARLDRFNLRAPAGAGFALYSSCAPCAMCLGGILWSGVGTLVYAAGKADAAAIGFDEGPVFPESWAYLEARGVSVRAGVLGDEARAVLELYRARGGLIYNG